jgi:glycosyltransferase involved in cell wall biosynthesis
MTDVMLNQVSATDSLANETASVSVIIPCYNSIKTLERAVKSVAEQTLRPGELILVDDGSTDSTVEFMHLLKNKYGKDWICIIELGADLGVSTARNSGWEKASNKFVAFLDSDDSWHSNKIEIQYSYMEENPQVVMTGHRFEIINEEAIQPNLKLKFDTKVWFPSKLILTNPFVTPSVMISASIPERFQAGRSDMDDHLLWLEIAFNYGSVTEIMLPLAALYKPQWGAGGLGSRLWIMEKGELKNYWYLRATKRISTLNALGLSCFSLAKFSRRLFIRYILNRTSG